MRKRTAILLVTLVLTFAVLTSPAECADCIEGGSVWHDCMQEEIQDLNDCCQVFGCNSAWSNSYCSGRSKDVFSGCAILHGCPNLAY